MNHPAALTETEARQHVDDIAQQVAQQLDPRAAKPCFAACPFGCPPSFDLADPGYCRHLVGFSNDKKGVDLRDRFYGRERTGVQTRAVQAGDLFVPVKVLKRTAVGFRVYREDGQAPVEVDVTPPALNRHVLQKRIDQMREQLDNITARETPAPVVAPVALPAPPAAEAPKKPRRKPAKKAKPEAERPVEVGAN